MNKYAPASDLINGSTAVAAARSQEAIFADLFPAERPGHCATGRLLAEGKACYLIDHPRTANHAAQGEGARRTNLTPPGGVRSNAEVAFARLVVAEATRLKVSGWKPSTVFRKLGWGEHIDPEVLADVEGTEFETTKILDALAKLADADKQRDYLKTLREPEAAKVAGTWCGDRVPGIIDNLSRFYVPDVVDAAGKLLVPSVDLWRNDSRRVLPRLLNNGRSFKIVAADPPYGVRRKDSDGRTIVGDEDPRPIASWFSRLCFDLAAADSFTFLCTSNDPKVCHVWEGEALARADKVDRLIWDKGQGSALGDSSTTFNCDVEHVLVAHKGAPKLRCWGNIPRVFGDRETDQPSIFEDKAPGALVQRDSVLWPIPAPRAAGPGDTHPSRKPVALGIRILLNGSDEGDIVLDPAAGTAPFGVAAVRLRRRYLGIECQRDFFEEGVRRLKDALAAQYPEQFGT